MNDTLLQKIRAYRPNQTTLDLIADAQILLLTGITAAGKNTIMGHLSTSGDFYDIVTCTTRQPRENSGIMEVDGREYHFLDFLTAEKMIDEQRFIEVKQVHTNVYGTNVDEFVRATQQKKIAMADIDVQGADEFLGFNLPNLKVLFVVPPSFEVWLERLKGRYGGTLEGHREEIIARFNSARKEIAHALADGQYIPVMNIDSHESAMQIRRVLHGEDELSSATIAFARERLQSIERGLEDYIALLQ